MGADLYITNMDRAKQYLGFEVSKKAVDVGYFRDCYNDGGLFPTLSANTSTELSWWITKRRKELFNKQGLMTVAGAAIWLTELEPLVEKFKKLKTLYYGKYNTQTSKHEKGKKIKDKQEYFDWADLLITFINLAIERKSTIIWSV